MTCTDVSGHNFWGGGTYVHGQQEYAELDNQGRVAHRDWLALGTEPGGCDDRRATRLARSRRRAPDGRATHHRGGGRRTGVPKLPHQNHLSPDQRDRRDAPVLQRGHQGQGQGRLWRVLLAGPRSFTGGTVFTSRGAANAEDAMGTRAEWLAFMGQHDGAGRHSTLIFVDHPTNPRYPSRGSAVPAVRLRELRLHVRRGVRAPGRRGRAIRL